MQGPYGPQGTPINTNMMNPIGTEAWRTGLFDCMDDPNNGNHLTSSHRSLKFMIIHKIYM